MRPIVLIADNDPDDRIQIEQALAGYDLEILLAEDTDSAVKVFIERGPTLVFIDAFFPRRGGIDLLRRLRSASGGRAINVIMLCGVKGLNDLRDEAMNELDARAFLLKPLKTELLRSKVEGILAPHVKADSDSTPYSIFACETLPQKGELSAIPFTMLFKQLVDSGYSGALRLMHEKELKAVYFSGGEVIFATSNRVTETLGRRMLDTGVITAEVYRKALEEMQSSGRKFGELVLLAGALDEEGIDRAVVEHIFYKVSTIFSWSVGRFALGQVQPPPMALAKGRIDAKKLLWQGVMSQLPLGDLLSLLKNHLDSYLIARRDPLALESDVDLVEDDRIYLLGARNFPGRTLRQALSDAAGEREMRLLTALFALDVFAVSTSPSCDHFPCDEAGEEMRKLANARKTLLQMRGQNFFQILGVGISADDAKVRQTYQEMAKRFHPDTLPSGANAELRRIHTEIVMLLNSAFEKLEKGPLRSAYLASLHTGIEDKPVEGARLLDAETSYQRGQVLMKKRNWLGALPHLERAVLLNPDEPEYAVQTGIAKMNIKEGDRAKLFDEAKRHFQRAAELDPRSAEPLYRLGYLYKLSGENTLAGEYFQRALARNSGHVQARLELRLLGARAGKG